MIIGNKELADYYAFDLKNGFPFFTPKNLLLVDALIRYNSNYSVTADKSHPEYKESYSYILENKKDKFFNFDGYELEKVVRSIDKINSTHLTSEGNSLPKGATHNGIMKTVNRIKEINNLKERMINADPEVVFEIASAVDTKYNFSFATKFCAYVSEIALDITEGYCIYDDIVQAILPLYIYHYVDKETAIRNCKIINKNKPNIRIESNVSRFKSKTNQNGYREYRELIDSVIKGIENKDGIKVTYSEFDHMLWYYFKGSKRRIEIALKTLLQDNNLQF